MIRDFVYFYHIKETKTVKKDFVVCMHLLEATLNFFYSFPWNPQLRSGSFAQESMENVLISFIISYYILTRISERYATYTCPKDCNISVWKRLSQSLNH